MKSRFYNLASIFSAFVMLFLYGQSTLHAAVSQSGYQIAPEGAWCWFADPRAIHNQSADGSIDATYYGYIDVHGNVKATQYDHLSGRSAEVLLRSYFQPDDHNNPTFLVLPDGRVLIIYSRHTDEPAFYYRVSNRPGDITDMGAEKKIVTKNNTTYPSPFILSDDPDHFYLCWRGIGWHPTIAKFTMPDENGDVKCVWGPYQMVQSTGARPYAKYFSNGKDKIYVAYTTGHPDNELPNWLYFNVINISPEDGGTPVLQDLKGNRLSRIDEGKFNVNKKTEYQEKYPMTIVDAPADERAWVWQIALEGETPVIAMVRISPDKKHHEYYYAKWNGNGWDLTDLADGGGKFHGSDTEYCYSGGMSLDPSDPSQVLLSIPTPGAFGNIHEIWLYKVGADGKFVEKKQLTSNSTKNNVRPFVLPGSEGKEMRYAWMNGEYDYWMVNRRFPRGYPTRIMANAPAGDGKECPLIKNALKITYKDGVLENGAAKKIEKLVKKGKPFAVELTAELDSAAYGGKILDTPKLSFGIEAGSNLPWVEVLGKRGVGDNVFLSSDNWALNSNGTQGDSWPTLLENVVMTFLYDGKRLMVLRDGAIDYYNFD